jgi:hypothetical protein
MVGSELRKRRKRGGWGDLGDVGISELIEF